MSTPPSPLTLGHVHLKVRDIDQAVAFYTAHLGLIVEEQVAGRYAFLSDGKAHHTVALQSVGPGAPQPGLRSVGLYHTAFEVSDRQAFRERYHALRQAGLEPVAVDHGISWAMYFNDPDGNGLEIYADTRHEIRGDKQWHGVSRPLTPHELEV